MKRRIWSFKVWPVLVSAGAAAVAMAPGSAKAQLDVNPPLPNVLLLLDTSGSLERMTDRTELPTEGAINNCNAGADYEKNRWATVVNALTGTVQNPSCEPIDRSSASFRAQYGTNVFGADPYDYNYYLPFHRIASNGCVMSPDGSTYNAGTWWDFPSNAVIETDASFGACGGTFDQDTDGIIDTFSGRVRFGLATFDPLTQPDTDEVGAFSYWYRPTAGDNWSTSNQSTVGWPLACTTRLDMEVGIRNPSAPPWEGRLMGFGDYDIDYATVQANNDKVQTAILSMRPYGATPLAGMLADTEEFFFNDDSTISPAGGPDHDPTDPSQSLSPKGDPYWDFDPGSSFQCRKSFIVLLSDGEPNLDLRPDCDDPGGQDCSAYPGIPDGPPPNSFGCCPFDTPGTVAARLAQDTGANARDVDTFVIGIGLNSVDVDITVPPDGTNETVDCNDIIDDSLGPPGYITAAGGTFQVGGVCNRTGVDDAVVGLEACCALSSVAFNGDTERAYFPSSIAALKATFSQVLDDIASGSTGRTHPVFNNVRNRQWQDYDAGAIINGYQVLSSLDAPLGIDLWSGNLQRKRYDCSGGLSPIPLDVDDAEGDDFAKNLNDNLGARRYWGFNPDDTGGTAYPRRSIRPNLLLTDDDGMGVYGGSEATPFPRDLTTYINNMNPESFELDPSYPASFCDDILEASGNAALCMARLLEWNAGMDVVLSSTNYLRNSALGAIYHSTPNIVGPPSALVRDESYSTYAENEAGRPTMLYTATTDGQLHAFIVQLNQDPTGDNVPFLWPSKGGTDSEQNELWSFMPPRALAGLQNSFDQQSVLLDGVPVIQDVVYERDQAGAVGGAATWNRVLVMASGSTASSSGYYYAIDITDPRTPRFLWQLSTSDSDEPLFGQRTPTPAITNLSIDIAGVRKEVAVAILAGGSGRAVDPPGPPTAASCARNATGATTAPPSAPYAPRNNVRCWENTAANGPPSGASGRSVTIVRLDTGEVLMSLRADASEGPGGLTACPGASCNLLDVQFDSPMTGEPVTFPGGVGAVASRIYVGDEDGTLWRIDVSDPAPQNWTVDIAWDTFYNRAFDGGHMIPNAPITSVDEVGDTVLLFATGDQETFGYTAGQEQRVLSITDIPTGGGFAPMLNWQELLADGERVTGPMVLFDSVAYFATFAPNTNPTCEFGHAKVWGLDYRNPTPATTPPEGLAKFDDAGSIVKFIDEVDGSIVFGLAAVQVPSCSSSADVFDYFNPEARLSAVEEGAFQLVYSTGKGGTAAQGGDKTNTMTINLPQPEPFLRVDSYASIIE